MYCTSLAIPYLQRNVVCNIAVISIFHFMTAYRSTATETNEPTDITMKENAAYENVTKFKAVQKAILWVINIKRVFSIYSPGADLEMLKGGC